MLKIRLKRSYIGNPEKLRRVLRSLGLRKIGQTVVKPDVPSIRGMVNKVPHLVEVEEVRGE
ncbi:MAG TPA: 50S ribosomal protein L30 [Nitrospirae bacterium]|nr:50S ribosomal protein L30 [Nitrospirota bacterium]